MASAPRPRQGRFGTRPPLLGPTVPTYQVKVVLALFELTRKPAAGKETLPLTTSTTRGNRCGGAQALGATAVLMEALAQDSSDGAAQKATAQALAAASPTAAGAELATGPPATGRGGEGGGLWRGLFGSWNSVPPTELAPAEAASVSAGASEKSGAHKMKGWPMSRGAKSFETFPGLDREALVSYRKLSEFDCPPTLVCNSDARDPRRVRGHLVLPFRLWPRGGPLSPPETSGRLASRQGSEHSGCCRRGSCFTSTIDAACGLGAVASG